ncbi:MAG: threonine/serine exporter family protein [Oscillospiraceae bacterium]|nr:threonine/serine exporter family protein [Oscillospiraceae bacterium]
MNYNAILDATIELGYHLAINGAETYRVEESINRIMASYKIAAEVFAIPNCLIVTIVPPDGSPITRMRRIGHHGNDLDAVEQLSNLSRKICAETPDPEIVITLLQQTVQNQKRYPLMLYLLGNFFVASGFSLIFGSSYADSIWAGVCGIVVGLISKLMDRWHTNPFFKTISASFVMALLVYFSRYINISGNSDTIIIGALMLLVPGLLFTNAMRDIIYGDTNSGVNRIVQVFLTAAALALGTGAAYTLSGSLWSITTNAEVLKHGLVVECIACFLGSLGFAISFNIHGKGSVLCAIGGVITWLTYYLLITLNTGDIAAYFLATCVAALYSEIMARVRKCPAISYLVISLFPLIPGAGVYYATSYAVKGNMTGFANQGMLTLSIAGIMAVGIILISTVFRLISVRQILKTKSLKKGSH